MSAEPGTNAGVETSSQPVDAAPPQAGAGRTPLFEGTPTLLKNLGYDERWLHNWLTQEPSRLGLGEVEVIAQELNQRGGGYLDIFARQDKTYFSIEVQLGEVDASHALRVFDYWARNQEQERYEGKHVAVLVAESARGRFRRALEAMAEYLPLIVMELRVWRAGDEAVAVPEVVIAKEGLEVATLPEPGTERTPADWEAELTPQAWEFHLAFKEWATAEFDDVKVDYQPKSYVGFRRRGKVWAPLWFTKEGARSYLHDPDGVHDQEPSPAFEAFKEKLASAGVNLTWAYGYDGGTHPVSIGLTKADLEKPEVRELLRASYEITDEDAVPWSDRQAPPSDGGSNGAGAGAHAPVQGSAPEPS